MKDRGSIPLALLILIGLFVVVIIGLAMCGDAMFEDEDEENDLGWAGPAATAGDREDNRGGRNKNGRDCEGSEDCSTFSPSFEDSPIIVCVQPEACRFG